MNMCEAFRALNALNEDTFSVELHTLYNYFSIKTHDNSLPCNILSKVGQYEKDIEILYVVNIGTKDDPKWYYYDATRLAGEFADGTSNSCLITLAKLETYVTSKGEEGFYHFTPKSYPTVEMTPLS
jgi:hypothetical protein